MEYFTLEEILVHSNNCINYGYISELEILNEFIQNGFEVHIPFGNSQRYDLVVRIRDEFKKIQIKTAYLKKGGDISFTPYSISKGEYHSYKNEIDYFALHCKKNKKSYLIHIDEIKQEHQFKNYKIRKGDLNRYSIVNVKSAKKSPNSIAIEKIKTEIELTKKGNVILSPQSAYHRNILLFDRVKKLPNKSIINDFHTYEVLRDGTYKKIDIPPPNCYEKSEIIIKSDLMRAGCIVFLNYGTYKEFDFIFFPKYESNLIPYLFNNKKIMKFYSVKIIQESDLYNIDKIYQFSTESRNEIDYFGFYSKKFRSSYLIPSNEILKMPNELKSYEIKKIRLIRDIFNDNDLGEANELKIASEFIKRDYNVLSFLVGEARYDLVIKNGQNFYTVQVKMGYHYREKNSLYLRFNTSSKNSNGKRKNYKNQVDFFAVVYPLTDDCYIIPVHKLPNYDAKLKLKSFLKNRMDHHNTIYAGEYEIKHIKRIIQGFENYLKRESQIKKMYKHEFKSTKSRKEFEMKQILDLLKGKIKYKFIKDNNKTLIKMAELYKKVNYYNQKKLAYQGMISVGFRDFLIDKIIDKKNSKSFKKSPEKVKTYIREYYTKEKTFPNTIILYQEFINYKSFELRGFLNRMRRDFNHKL